MLSDPRRDVGATGERIAGWYLRSSGVQIIQTNLEMGDGEIDLIGRDGDDLVVFEVRTVTGGGDPIDALRHSKRRRVRRLAGRIGVARVDFVGVRLGPDHVDIHWVPG